MPVEDYLPEWEGTWNASGHNPEIFFAALLTGDKIDRDLYEHELSLLGIEPPPVGEELIPVVPIGEVTLRAEVHKSIADYFKIGAREFCKGFWIGVRQELSRQIKIIVDAVKPLVEEAWEAAKKVLTEAALKVYEGAEKLFEGHSSITPEDGYKIAGKLYAMAWGAGMAAHGISVVTELAHPLKTMGLHQTAAMVGDFGQFSRIAGAVMGPLVNRVMGQLVTYDVQNRYRPVVPNESLLIELRSKREIDKPTFDKAMGYQGFSKDWIDVIERWQWKDPRMFEICRLADVGIEAGEEPTAERAWTQKFGLAGVKGEDWWLQRKFMRAGYEDVDIPIMINFIHRREAAFAYTYVRTAIRRNYRYGYLTEAGLNDWMQKLGLPDEARKWIRWAGQLDIEYFYRRDLEMYYTLAFRNDIIDEDELMVSLLAMGLPAHETMLKVRTERVRKSPKVSTPTTAAAKKAMTEVQKKYVTLYITQYREDLITAERLRESLLAVGLDPELAEVSVALELAKKGLPAFVV